MDNQPECMRLAGLRGDLINNFMAAIFKSWTSDMDVGPEPQVEPLTFDEVSLPLGRLRHDMPGARHDQHKAGAIAHCLPFVEEDTPPTVQSV